MEEPKIMQIGSYVPNSQCAGKIVNPEGIAPTVMENHGMPSAVLECCLLGYTRDDKGNVQSYHKKEIAGTLHTSSGQGGTTDQFIQEQVIGSMQAKAMRGSLNGVSPCLTEAMGMGGGQIPMITEPRYRIRKLTPTECFRLMGVEDTDIEKIKAAKLIQTLKNGKIKEKPMPKTQLYKMAGNSIVTDVLYHIFKSMFIASDSMAAKTNGYQYSIFDYL